MPHAKPVIHSPGTIVKAKRSRLHRGSMRCNCNLNCAWLFYGHPHVESPIDFLSRCQIHEIQTRLPSQLQHLQWMKFFDTKEDGFSLSQIYRASDGIKSSRQRQGTQSTILGAEDRAELFRFYGGFSDREDGYDIPSLCLMVVTPRAEYSEGGGAGESVIGFFTTVLPNVTHHDARHFFGGKETFVFRFHHTTKRDAYSDFPYHGPGSGGIHTFHWTGSENSESHVQNQDFITCSKNFVGVGGGSHGGAAIYFDEELQFGTSTTYCETFGCSCLCGTPKNGLHHSEFLILRMVWIALGSFPTDSPSHVVEYCCPCERSSNAHSCHAHNY